MLSQTLAGREEGGSGERAARRGLAAPSPITPAYLGLSGFRPSCLAVLSPNTFPPRK